MSVVLTIAVAYLTYVVVGAVATLLQLLRALRAQDRAETAALELEMRELVSRAQAGAA